MSGVHDLAWHPTGPAVLAGSSWLGFDATCVMYWRQHPPSENRPARARTVAHVVDVSRVEFSLTGAGYDQGLLGVGTRTWGGWITTGIPLGAKRHVHVARRGIYLVGTPVRVRA